MKNRNAHRSNADKYYEETYNRKPRKSFIEFCFNENTEYSSQYLFAFYRGTAKMYAYVVEYFSPPAWRW